MVVVLSFGGAGGAFAGPAPARTATESALQKLESLNNGTSRLLYEYQRGLLLREAGDFRGSNQAFDHAESLIEDLYTKSVTREAGALLIGDYLLEYRGERFERAYLHYYKIMNYLELGEPNEALVECRRLNHTMELIKDAGGSFYLDDPFLEYLTAMVYSMTGQHSDANVSLRVALDTYRSLGPSEGVEMPGRLLCDLAENSRALGKLADAERYHEEGHCVAPTGKTPGASLTVFLECGRAPFLIENHLVLPIFKNEIGDKLDQHAFARELCRRRDYRARDREVEYLLDVALPSQRATTCDIAFARVFAVPAGPDSLDPGLDAPGAESVISANFRTLASKSFEEKQDEILLRAVTRGLLKYLATRAAGGKKRDRVAETLVNLAGVVTEGADTRSWSALPEKLVMSNMNLAPGKYRIEVELFGSSRRRIGFVSFPDVEIRGGNTILSRRVY